MKSFAHFRFGDLPPEIRALVYGHILVDPEIAIRLRYSGVSIYDRVPLCMENWLPPIPGDMCLAMTSRLMYHEYFPYYEAYMARSVHHVAMSELEVYLQSRFFASNTTGKLLIEVNTWATRDVDIMPLLQLRWRNPAYDCRFITEEVSPYIKVTSEHLNRLLNVGGGLKRCIEKGALESIRVSWRDCTMFATFIRTGHDSKGIVTQSLHLSLLEDLGIRPLRQIEWQATTLENPETDIISL